MNLAHFSLVTFIAHKILLTFAVNVEISFGKLKTYLRSTVSQERLLNIVRILTIENEITQFR